MGSDVAGINRAMAGDIAETIKDLTGLDLRAVKDPEVLILIADLKDLNERVNKDKKWIWKGINDLLDRDEKKERIRQFVEWQEDIREDVSRLGLANGNISISEGLDEGII